MDGDDDGITYPMWYDALLLYADKTCSSFHIPDWMAAQQGSEEAVIWQPYTTTQDHRAVLADDGGGNGEAGGGNVNREAVRNGDGNGKADNNDNDNKNDHNSNDGAMTMAATRWVGTEM